MSGRASGAAEVCLPNQGLAGAGIGAGVGRAAVLADEANASATFLFLTLVRRHALAPIGGRPAGGPRRGIDGGLVLFTRLPYSGVEVDVPFFAQEPREAAPDATLLRDVPVRWTAADVAAGRDPDLAAAARVLAVPRFRDAQKSTALGAGAASRR